MALSRLKVNRNELKGRIEENEIKLVVITGSKDHIMPTEWIRSKLGNLQGIKILEIEAKHQHLLEAGLQYLVRNKILIN